MIGQFSHDGIGWKTRDFIKRNIYRSTEADATNRNPTPLTTVCDQSLVGFDPSIVSQIVGFLVRTDVPNKNTPDRKLLVCKTFQWITQANQYHKRLKREIMRLPWWEDDKRFHTFFRKRFLLFWWDYVNIRLFWIHPLVQRFISTGATWFSDFRAWLTTDLIIVQKY